MKHKRSRGQWYHYTVNRFESTCTYTFT